MIWVEVKTLWQNKVGVRDKYIEEAVKSKQGLTIVHGEERMSVPFTKLKELIVGQSDRAFPDRFGNHPHRLVYFYFRPDAKQAKML